MPLARVALYVVVLAALGLIVRIQVEPVAGVWAAGGLVLLVVTVGLGLRHPEWEMFTDLLTSGPGGTHEAVLTFDGVPPDPALEPMLLLLKEHGVCATFFVAPQDGEMQSDVQRSVRALARDGHKLALLGNTTLDRDEALSVTSAFDDLRRLCGADAVVPALRPRTRLSVRTLGRVVKRVNVVLVGASVGWPDDPQPHQLEENVGPGAIVRMPAHLLDSEPKLLPKLLSASTRARVQWVPLEAWL